MGPRNETYITSHIEKLIVANRSLVPDIDDRTLLERGMLALTGHCYDIDQLS